MRVLIVEPEAESLISPTAPGFSVTCPSCKTKLRCVVVIEEPIAENEYAESPIVCPRCAYLMRAKMRVVRSTEPTRLRYPTILVTDDEGQPICPDCGGTVDLSVPWCLSCGWAPGDSGILLIPHDLSGLAENWTGS